MKLVLETPVKLRIVNPTSEELVRLQDILKYKVTSNQVMIRNLKKNYYYKQRFGEEWVNLEIDRLEKESIKSLLYEDGNGYYTLPGMKSRIFNLMGEKEFKNLVHYPEFKLMPWKQKPIYEPYPYQKDSVERMLKTPHSQISIATGCGKSLIAILLVKYTGLPTIISTPSASIARQFYEELTECFGKGKVGLFGDGKREIGKDILVCVGKSLSLVEEPMFVEFRKYQILVSDESHTLPAQQFEKFCHEVLAHCPYRWFLSATQERNDGTGLLLNGIIGDVVYSKTIQEAITEGYLAKLSFMVFDVESKDKYAGDQVVKVNQKHLYKNKKVLEIISKLVPQAINRGMPVLILIDEHSQELDLRNTIGNIYEYACGGSDTGKIVKDFNEGKTMCVVGTSAISTGTNFKPVRLTINWRGNKAGTKTKQGAIGRSTRLDERTGKKDCRIVDFRVTNIPMLKRHAGERIKLYKEIGPLTMVKYE